MAVLNLLALSLNQPVQAMNAYWAGGEGNWMSNIAWVDGLVPNYILDRVFIDDLINPAITSKVHLNTSVSVGQVFIGAGDELRIEQGSLSLYGGVLSNNGRLTIAGTASGWGSLVMSAHTTLNGTGTTVLYSDPNSYGAVIGGSGTLTIANGHTVRGNGYLGDYWVVGSLNVVNQGTVIAEGGTLTLYQSSGQAFDNTAGLIQIAANGILQQSGQLTGGQVQSLGSGARIGGGTFSDVVLAGPLAVASSLTLNNATVQDSLLVSAATLYATGPLTNSGTLAITGNNSGWGVLNTASNTTLAGTGTTVLSSDPNSYSAVIGGSGTLTIANGHTVRGNGYLGDYWVVGSLNVVNQGTVIAEGGTLTLYQSSGQAFDNTAGLIQIANGAKLHGQGTVNGGTIQGLGDSRLSGGTFQNLALTGTLAIKADTVSVAGTLTNSGTLTLTGNNSGWSVLNTSSNTTLAGTGTTVLSSVPNSYSAVIGGSGTLTIANGHTVRGNGYLGDYWVAGSLNVVNLGTVIAEGGTLTLYQSSGQAFDNTHGGLRIDETGAVNVSGNLLLGDQSQLSFDIASIGGVAAFGLLTLNSAATFDGTLHLNFESYTPTIGEQFHLIDFSGSYTGAFDAATANGYTLSLSYANSSVVATITGVSAVPEPETWALWLAGGLTLLQLRRGRHKN